MELPARVGHQRRRRRARRISCHDAQHRMQFVGLWAVPWYGSSSGVIVMVPPAAESVRFDRDEAISLRAALDEMIAELPAPWCE